MIVPFNSKEETEAALNAFVASIATQYGMDIKDAVKLISTNMTVDGGSVRGAYADQGPNAGTIYVNDAENENGIELSGTTAHETAHMISADNQVGDDEEAFASVMGDAGADYFAFNYSNQGLGELSDGDNNNHVGFTGPRTVTTTDLAFERDAMGGNLDYYDPNYDFYSTLEDTRNHAINIAQATAQSAQDTAQFVVDHPELLLSAGGVLATGRVANVIFATSIANDISSLNEDGLILDLATNPKTGVTGASLNFLFNLIHTEDNSNEEGENK